MNGNLTIYNTGTYLGNRRLYLNWGNIQRVSYITFDWNAGYSNSDYHSISSRNYQNSYGGKRSVGVVDGRRKCRDALHEHRRAA